MMPLNSALPPLPIDSHLTAIIAAAGASRSVVLVAEPGAGKTTRVAPALLSSGVLDGDHPKIALLQPRRVAARAVAERIAAEQNWAVGGRVGYQVRFERRIGPDTLLAVMTEGILARRLIDDAFVEGTGAVLLDEFHERSIHTDLALALLREVQQTVRPDLIILVMSATLDAQPVAAYLGGCPIIQVPGRTFPVTVSHPLQPSSTRPDDLADAVAEALERALATNQAGDVLVFLPGAEEIRRCQDRLSGPARDRNLLLLPLYGSLSFEEQAAALRPSSRQKIILSTNIAETSLTIEGIRTVIDTGLARIAAYDPDRGMDRLDLQRISRASATQRAGRAGRTAPGRCSRLWTEAEDRRLAPFQLPEIRRVDLAGTVLGLHGWGKRDIRAFGWFEPPTEEAVSVAETLLTMLGALQEGVLTPMGRKLLALPLHPRLARLMIGAAADQLDDAAALAALLEEKDILPRQRDAAPTVGSSDLLYRLSLLKSGGARHELDPQAVRQVLRAKESLLRVIPAPLPRQAASGQGEAGLLKLVLLAYPDRVARRRSPSGRSAVMVGGVGLQIAAESVVRQAEFFVAVDARDDDRRHKREALVRIASAIDPAWLSELFPNSIRRERIAEFDDSRQQVVGRGRVWYRDLMLQEDADAAVDPAEAGRILGQALRPRAREIFEKDEDAAQWLARFRVLSDALPERAWPKLDDPQLADLLAIAAANKRSVRELTSQGLTSVLHGTLQYPLDRLLEREAPAILEVPSGSRIRLDYASGRPVLAVRLQEIFGWTQTPRIAEGRVPVLLHLLAPNFRPVQITDNLASFWSSTYFQVRKDLRARYPKHAWPDDPLTAAPQAKGRARFSAS